MKRLLWTAAAAIALAAGLFAWQTAPSLVWIYGWNGGPIWYRLGPTLAITSNQIDVQLPPQRARRYDVALAYDATKGGWTVPGGALNLVIYVNGLRYSPGNYSISNGLLTANFGNMLPEHEVTADFDAP